MTATERAKRSDALYYETVSVTRRVLCDMIANREADLEDVRAENAKLRESLEFANSECEKESIEYLSAQDQNAKLRELCATVIDDWMSKVCPSFPFCEFGGEYQDCTDETCGNQIYRQMARELGVDE